MRKRERERTRINGCHVVYIENEHGGWIGGVEVQVSFALYQEREEATGVSPGLGALAKFEWLVSRGREVFRIRNRGESTSSREREWTSYSIARCIARTRARARP